MCSLLEFCGEFHQTEQADRFLLCISSNVTTPKINCHHLLKYCVDEGNIGLLKTVYNNNIPSLVDHPLIQKIPIPLDLIIQKTC